MGMGAAAGWGERGPPASPRGVAEADATAAGGAAQRAVLGGGPRALAVGSVACSCRAGLALLRAGRVCTALPRAWGCRERRKVRACGSAW